MKLLAVLLLSCGLALPTMVWAHGGEKHEEKPGQTPPVAVEAPPSDRGAQMESQAPVPAGPPAARPVTEQPQAPKARLSAETLMRDLNFADFPTLHPLAVHVPVTFLPLALLFALSGLFSLRRIYTGLAFGFTLGGLAGGFVAAFPLHPHTTGLAPAARETLEKHDLFAYGTLWLALFAALLGLVCLWKPGRLRKLLFCGLLLLATLSVSITAHYGGTLAYVHGVGVQGRYLIEH